MKVGVLMVLILINLLLFESTLFSQIPYLDGSFGNHGIVSHQSSTSSEVRSMALHKDGKIVAVGYANDPKGDQIKMVRFLSNGILDAEFGMNSTVYMRIKDRSVPSCISIQEDQKIVVGGSFTDKSKLPANSRFVLVRFNTNGSVDTSFGAKGIATITIDTLRSVATSIAIAPDGGIVVGGEIDDRFLVVKFTKEGKLDKTFGDEGKVITSLGLSSHLFLLKMQSDGKILASGNAGTNSDQKFALVKYTKNGVLDSAFGDNGKVITDMGGKSGFVVANLFVTLSDKKIMVAGAVNSRLGMVRYMENGAIDSSFGVSGILFPANYSPSIGMEVQSDGKYIFAESKKINNYDYGWNVFRLHANGKVDSTFGTFGNYTVNIDNGNDYAQCLILQPDTKILIGGSSKDTTSTPAKFAILRLSTDLVTQINKVENTPNVQIYPNPFEYTVVIDCKDLKDRTTLLLYDMLGRMVREDELVDEKTTIELGGLLQGIYCYQIVDTNKNIIAIGKLIKE